MFAKISLDSITSNPHLYQEFVELNLKTKDALNWYEFYGNDTNYTNQFRNGNQNIILDSSSANQYNNRNQICARIALLKLKMNGDKCD